MAYSELRIWHYTLHWWLNTHDVIASLENSALVLFKWFENNLIKANSNKSHLPQSTSTSSTANINGDIIKNSESEKRLGVTVDYKLNFWRTSVKGMW